MSRLGTVAFIVIALGYFGLEAYAGRRAAKRTKPTFIHAKMAAATHAVARCGVLDADISVENGRRNLARMRVLAIREVEARPDAGTADAEATVDARAAEVIAEVDALVEGEGCKSSKIWAHRKTFDIYARKTLGQNRGVN